MADTILHPATPAEPNKADTSGARIGTSSDKSWAGWAISSFTNKLAAADGDIEPTAASKSAETEASRSASVPRPAKSSPSTQLELPKETTLRPAAQPLGRSLSDRPVPVVQHEEADEGDDVFDAWGAMDDDDNEDDSFSAAVASPKPSSPDPFANKPTAKPFDDGGEPDFAGWLAAKNQSKAKKPLPKGLSKAASTNTAPTKSTVAAAKPRTTAPAKKIDTKPKDEDEDDGWGAWD
jgi:SCY1-like protein 1